MITLTETRERFLLAITTRVPAERIAEIHFFQPIRQAGVESGVAVVVETGQVTGEPGNSERQAGEECLPSSEDNMAAPSAQSSPRYIIHTARYRLTLKGLDRGKWEASVFAEADAPLVTVETVVRGVQRRSGDIDDVTRVEGDDVRALVDSTRVP